MRDGETNGRIPELDLRRWYAAGPQRTAFLRELREAAHEVGFFYVAGHGIGAQLQQDLMNLARRFFALPERDKLAVEMLNSPHFRGYNRVAAELTRGRPDWREQIDFGAERQALTRSSSSAWTRLQGPNQWPAALPELQGMVALWQDAAISVLIPILQAFALSLRQPADVFEPLYGGDPHYVTKLIRYPDRAQEGGDGQGVGAHKDSELLTLLLQDDHAGLQVETSQGWVDVPPRPGTFVVNIGELLELASDGYLRATLHRVVTPPIGVSRISAAFFLGARLDAIVPLLPLPPALKSQARGAERDPSNPLFREVGLNYLKGRLEPSPTFFRRCAKNAARDRLEDLQGLHFIVAADMDAGVDQIRAAGDQRRNDNRFPEPYPSIHAFLSSTFLASSASWARSISSAGTSNTSSAAGGAA